MNIGQPNSFFIAQEIYYTGQPLIPLRQSIMASRKLEKSIFPEKKLYFKLAQYNAATKKINFSYDEVLTRIKQVCGKNKSKVAFATSVGHPKSGKTFSLNRLVKYWNGASPWRTDSAFPQEISNLKGFAGILLVFTEVPRVFGSTVIYLICLDVVCDSSDSAVYKSLMQVCYRMSNMIIFTFGNHEDDLLKIDYERNDSFKAAASFLGYNIPATVEYFSFYENAETLPRSLNSECDDSPAVRKLVLELSSVSDNIPIQFEYVGSNHLRRSSEQNTETNLYNHLVSLLQDVQFQKTLRSASGLPDAFGIVSLSCKNQLIASEVECAASYFGTHVSLGAANLFTESDAVPVSSVPPTTTSHLRLRSTGPAPSASSDANHQKLEFEMAKLKLRASFKEVVPRLINSVGTMSFANAIHEFNSAWFQYHCDAPACQVDNLIEEMANEVADCCNFFSSVPSIVHKHYEDRLYLSFDQLERLEAELKMTLTKCLDNFQHEKDYLKTLCGGILANVVSSIASRNADIIGTEELLADAACHAAFESYTAFMDRRLLNRICSKPEVCLAHEETSKKLRAAFFSFELMDNVVWKIRIENLVRKMRNHLGVLVDRMTTNLTVFRKKAIDTYESCKNVHDRLFARKVHFVSLGDLRREGESALVGALEMLEELQDQLLQAGVREVVQMLKSYNIESMLRCAPSINHAAEVLAKKSHVTIVFGGAQSTHVNIWSNDIGEPLLLDPRLCLFDGRVSIIDSYIARKHESVPWLSFNDLASKSSFYRRGNQNHEVSLAIGNCVHPEQVMSVYLKEVKKYLLEVHNLIPRKLTVVVDDKAEFVTKHRIKSAICLAGLPSPKFMFHTGAVASGFFDKTPLQLNGKIMFFLVQNTRVNFAECHLDTSVQARWIDFAWMSSGEEWSFVEGKIRDSPDVESFVVLHQISPSDLVDIRKIRPTKSFHVKYVTEREILELAAGGAAFVDMYSEAAYSEVSMNNVTLRLEGAEKTIAKYKSWNEQEIIKLIPLEPVAGIEETHLEIHTTDEEIPSIRFRFSTLRTEKYLSVWRLSKDGILSKPEIRIIKTKEQVPWEMTGDLMPWNHQDFETAQNPEGELWKLVNLEATPMMLKNASVQVMREKMKKIMDQIDECLQKSFVGAAVARQALVTLEEGKILLEAADFKPAKVAMMIKKLKMHLLRVKGSQV